MNFPPCTTVWLFCRVIDNFGDAGVSWRLAKNLHRDLGWQTALWIDDLATLAALQPQIRTDARTQSIDGIRLYRWDNDADMTPDLSGSLKNPPDLIIEMFACTLPESVRALICPHNILWLNWEYLSAEDWAENAHLLPSPQKNGAQKYFYFMGFSEKSGGLLREKYWTEKTFRQPENGNGADGTLRIFAFGYASPVWQKWWQCWQQTAARLHKSGQIALAGAQIVESLQHLPRRRTQPAPPLKTFRQPFVPQEDFDALLADNHILIVRGEDSFVRAQYAARPFFWQIYPQEDNAHAVKLHAFWQRVYTFFPPALAQAHRVLSDELNGIGALDDDSRSAHWQLLAANLPQWQNAAQQWRDFLFSQPSAAEKLAQWVQLRLK